VQKNENPVILSAILFAITAVAALLLAFTNSITIDKIEAGKIKEQNEARAYVMPDAADFEEVYSVLLYEWVDHVNAVYAAKDDAGNVIGYCVDVSSNGFGGAINMIVGISADDEITGVKIVSMSETPGLGSKAQEPKFKDQFTGKKTDEEIKVIKSGTPADDEIIAISGATVTSKAVTSGINTATAVVKTLK
jgi:electron transport complex protein RnfG